MLNIKKTVEEAKAVVALEGRLDTVTAPELESDLMGIIEGIDELVLDFAELDYISSAGLRVLLSAQKMMNKKEGAMKIINVKDVIMDIFDMTGFLDILTVE